MSDRTTSRWTETAEEAFNNPKGRAGEKRVIRHLIASGCENVVDHEADKQEQTDGIDISYTYKNLRVTVQVKENYYIETPVVRGAPASRTFIVEIGDKKNIRNVKADLMFHVNIEHNKYVAYMTEGMVAYLDETNEDELNTLMCREVKCVRFQDSSFSWLTVGELKS